MNPRKHLLKLLYLTVLVFFSLTCAAYFFGLSLWTFYLLALLFLLALLSWLYLGLRVLVFRRQLVNFLRRILANDYSTGVRGGIWLGDEAADLGQLINKMADQLRAYDKLRMEKIALFHRAIDLIFRHVKEGMILVDVDRESLLLNPAVQEIFGIDQEKLSFDSIQKQENNKEFNKLFKQAVEQGKLIETCVVDLQLPIRNSRQNVCIRIVPLKDEAEKVRLAMIFVDRPTGLEQGGRD
ncbi:MAG: PAS domain-containing protein [Candidatus Saganbacteria bacterium]|nr:PAS domain-containing protein [Candidatus Saganbacteria bacterium]